MAKQRTTGSGLVILLLCASVSLLHACTPNRTVALADGSALNLETAAMDWLVVNYWAPWCGPCREEIPVLNELSRTHGPEILVLGVHLDGTRGERLAADIAEMDIRFPVVVGDPGMMLGLRESPVVPVTWILDANLKVRRMLVGPQDTEALHEAMALL